MNDEDVLMVASFGVRCSLLLFLYLYFFVLVLMLDFTIHSITHHVSPNPSDSSLLSPAHSKRACKSSSCSHSCVLTIPVRCGYHSRSPAGGWQKNDAACDSSLPC